MKANSTAMHAISHTFNGATGGAYEKIQNADAALKLAASELARALESAWPVGSEVEFYLNGNQRKPSQGVVLYHREGYVRVRMGEKSIYGSYTMRQVHYTNMATPPRVATKGTP